jgi:hypothetical protein
METVPHAFREGMATPRRLPNMLEEAFRHAVTMRNVAPPGIAVPPAIMDSEPYAFREGIMTQPRRLPSMLEEALRHVVTDLHWLEYTIGWSWQDYGTLDLYMDVVSDAPDAEESTWFNANVSMPPQERKRPRQDAFLLFSDYVCQGQRALPGMKGRRQYPVGA